jgi:hypothetical protein
MKLGKVFSKMGAFLMTLMVMFMTAVQFCNEARERNFHRLLVLRPGDAEPFPMDTRLSAIVIAYKNQDLIADIVSPRVPVGLRIFKYMKYNLAEGFTVVDNKVGRKSPVNKVEFSATQTTDSTITYGLGDIVPQEDIDNAPANYDPLGRATEGIADLNDLNREMRTAALIFSLNSYASANRITLSSANDKFSDKVHSTPIDVIMAGLDAMIMRANTMVIGQAAWTKLRTHPQIVSAILGNAGVTGIVSKQQVADLFELKSLVVGPGFVNTQKKGQTPVMARVWGGNISLMYQDPLADTNNRATFSLTAQFGPKVAYSYFNKDLGLQGAIEVKAGDNVKELLTAPDLGYYIEACI